MADNKRAGVLGLGGVLAMTSRYQETSPVLRGAWALETLLGTPVPPPPPDVPPLKEPARGVKLAMWEGATATSCKSFLFGLPQTHGPYRLWA